MNLIDVPPTVLPALTGILSQEVIQWYKIAGIHGTTRSLRKLKTPAYWLVFIAFCCIGTLAIYYYTNGDPQYHPRDALILGAAFPTLLRQLAAAANVNASNRSLGPAGDFLHEYLV